MDTTIQAVENPSNTLCAWRCVSDTRTQLLYLCDFEGQIPRGISYFVPGLLNILYIICIDGGFADLGL